MIAVCRGKETVGQEREDDAEEEDDDDDNGKVGVSMDGKGVLDSFAAAAMRGGGVMLQQRLDERRRW